MKIEIVVPPQLAMFFELIGMNPEQAILSYVNNLAQSPIGSSGSDERMYAREFFLRDLPSMDNNGFEYDDIKGILSELEGLRYTHQQDGDEAYKEAVNDWYERWGKLSAIQRA